MADVFARHTMVRPSARAWAAMIAKRPDLASDALVAGWVDAGWPLVVRRPTASDKADTVPLGLPLPPSAGKRRIAVTLDAGDIVSTEMPPSLSATAASAPAGWSHDIERLLCIDPSTRTFGSLAWQHLTGLSYLNEGSDLDLIWHLSPEASVDALLEGIGAIDATAAMRIDGEVTGAAGAVQWRELRDAAGDILVKIANGIASMSRAEFLAGDRA